MKPEIDYSHLFDLTGKVALVTGASGSLGGEIAIGLSSCGARLILSGRNKEKLDSLTGKIRSRGNTALPIVGDVSIEQDVLNLVDSSKREFGRIDILVASAGENFLSPARDYPIKNWKKLMDTNALGTFLCDREVGKVMLEQKQGKIINVSSIRGGFATSSNTVAYSASKAAVNMITKQLACEWARSGINVNAVAPAMILSGMHSGEGSEQVNAKVLEGITKRTPMKRLASPEDVVGTVIFLASKASDFVTGQILYVDGGASAWAA